MPKNEFDSGTFGSINQFKGKVGMIFITHAMPKSLQVDEVVRIGKGALGVVGEQHVAQLQETKGDAV